MQDTQTVTYRLLESREELAAASRVITEVWQDPALAPVSLLRAYTYFGNPTIGVLVDGEIRGACVGFLAPGGGVHLHSHITGVLPGFQHLGLGYGLKIAQRDWCLANGVDEVTWTFDPMVARNAYFNLRKLGAVATTFLPDFYGAMEDAMNAGDVTDRLEVHWYLRSARAEAPVERTVAVPSDYHALRASAPDEAAAERTRVRTALADAFGDGLAIVDFDAERGYCFARLRP